jgi:hypothetical protein
MASLISGEGVLIVQAAHVSVFQAITRSSFMT